MKVYESWGVTDLIEDPTSAEWYESLYAYHPNWSQWPASFWIQHGRHKEWSWYEANHGR